MCVAFKNIVLMICVKLMPWLSVSCISHVLIMLWNSDIATYVYSI